MHVGPFAHVKRPQPVPACHRESGRGDAEPLLQFFHRVEFVGADDPQLAFITRGHRGPFGLGSLSVPAASVEADGPVSTVFIPLGVAEAARLRTGRTAVDAIFARRQRRRTAQPGPPRRDAVRPFPGQEPDAVEPDRPADPLVTLGGQELRRNGMAGIRQVSVTNFQNAPLRR